MSLRGIPLLFFLLSSLFLNTKLQAQVKFSNSATSHLIDFSSTMQVSVGTNALTAFAGAGFSANPTTAGRLNSFAWAITGWSDGALSFGGMQITSNTDYTRGSASTAQSTGGIYAYTGLPGSVSNPCLMFQPGGTDFAPGTITLRVQNDGITNITQLNISYDLFVRNDEGRANSFNFSYSADDITYTPVAALDYTTPELADGAGWVAVGTAPSRSTTITGLNVSPGSYYYVRWSSADVSGSGFRDEIGLDNINMVAVYNCAPPPISSQPSNTSACVGSNAVFNTSTSAGSPVYQWQASVNGSSGWANVVNGTPAGASYSNATTSSLTVNSTAVIAQYFYRCKISASGCDAFTNPAKLVVNSAPAITSQPANAIICNSGNASLAVLASGTNLTPQWQGSANGSTGWADVADGAPAGATYTGKTALTLNVNTISSNYFYRCIVANAGCTSETSNVVSVTVSPAPADPGATITVSANPSCGPVTLSYPAGFYWQTTAAGISVANPTSSNYVLNTTGTIYVRAFNGNCWSMGNINTGVISINTAPVITGQPTDVSVISPNSASFTVTTAIGS